MSIRSALLSHAVPWPAIAKRISRRAVLKLWLRQARIDAFLIFAVVGIVLSFLVLFMKRFVVEKGAHIAAE
jgi:hypothetical protein